jgi:DNA polymerase alpha subunit A
LYNQLLFFDHIFDVEKAKKAAAGTANQGKLHLLRLFMELIPFLADEIIALTIQNASEFGTVQHTVRQYLDRCGRRYVGFKSLFSFMRLS